MPSGAGAFETQRSAPRKADPPRRLEERPPSARQVYDGSDRSDSNSLQRRQSRWRSSDSASTPSAPPVAEPSAAPRCLQSLLIRGGGAPNVHVFLVVGGGHGPTRTVAEAEGSAPERAGESVANVEATGPVESNPQEGGLEARSPRAGGLKARNPRAGLVGPPDEESPGALQDVSLRLLIFFIMILPT
jgi:hypothetical protein